MSFFSKVHERILRKFIHYGVDFVLIGGHAVVYHGVRRTTADIDILVRPSIENGEKILKAFRSLKLQAEDIQPEDFENDQVFSFGMEPDAVDIINFSVGIPVDSVFKNAVSARIDDLVIKIIDIRDLLRNKQDLKRGDERGLVDQQDILALKRILKSK